MGTTKRREPNKNIRRNTPGYLYFRSRGNIPVRQKSLEWWRREVLDRLYIPGKDYTTGCGRDGYFVKP